MVWQCNGSSFKIQTECLVALNLQAVEQGSRGNSSTEPSITLFNGQRAHV